MTAEVVHVSLRPGADLEGFRAAARRLAGADVPPQRVAWRQDGAELFAVADVSATNRPLMIAKPTAELIATVIQHRAPERHALLYQLIWRTTHGERALLEVASDPLVWRLQRMAKSVRRDIHKMHAFVRFRRVETADGTERYVAWFEPDHFILEGVASFFIDRFRGLDWTILTPQGRLRWDGRALHRGPPARRGEAPAEDAFEAHWLGYYESTFNPARVNPALMRKEMPRRYWKNLPEAPLIDRLVSEAPRRAAEMVAREATTPRKRDPALALAAMGDQAPASLDALNRIIAASRPPAPFAPRAVLGEGPLGAAIAVVGEQPGDQEDLAGRPFVGPAGQLLDQALSAAGLTRSELYVTNAVKHFKHQLIGKRRLHKTPTAGEVKHYRWWLHQELAFVRPRLTIALGATAALALAGRPLPVTTHRGPARFDDPALSTLAGFITVHPSYLLRLPDDARPAAYDQFVTDLRAAAEIARNLAADRAA